MNLFNSELFSDAGLILIDSEKQVQLPIHKAILASKSEYFLGLFNFHSNPYSDLHSNNEKQIFTIAVENVDLALELLLWIYNSNSDPTTYRFEFNNLAEQWLVRGRDCHQQILAVNYRFIHLYQSVFEFKPIDNDQEYIFQAINIYFSNSIDSQLQRGFEQLMSDHTKSIEKSSPINELHETLSNINLESEIKVQLTMNPKYQHQLKQILHQIVNKKELIQSGGRVKCDDPNDSSKICVLTFPNLQSSIGLLQLVSEGMIFCQYDFNLLQILFPNLNVQYIHI